MKLFTLTNRKTGQVVRRNATQADIDALKNCRLDNDNPNASMLDKVEVQEFSLPEPKAVTFVPDYLKPRAVQVQEETKGASADAQNIDGSESK